MQGYRKQMFKTFIFWNANVKPRRFVLLSLETEETHCFSLSCIFCPSNEGNQSLILGMKGLLANSKLVFPTWEAMAACPTLSMHGWNSFTCITLAL